MFINEGKFVPPFVICTDGWLGHYATSWKVMGSIPDVIGIFN
jgi:hypothetical protein